MNSNKKVAKDFGQGFPKGFVKVNHWDFALMGHVTEEMLAQAYNQPVQKGDVWVVTLPKCGTTWTQEMVWLLANDVDFEGAKSPLHERFHFLEFAMLHDPDHVNRLVAKAKELMPQLPFDVSSLTTMQLGHRRFVKTHLPLSLTPPDLLSKAKVVYVARNPKDMLVSYFNHLKLLKMQGFDSDLETLFEYFIKGQALEVPFFPHVLEAWNLRHHPNMCFLFFEDMKRDLKGSVSKVATFLGKTLSEQQLDDLAHHLHFDNFKKNPFVNNEVLKIIPGFADPERSFVRKGKTGDWKNHFTPEMGRRMDAWIAENLRGTDLTFVDQLANQ
ncbi:sulfotransferase 1C4-like isoform X2 [Pollicipes pollicipes]|nr:sulfotransferase 1C4-like isoform X2 [Pollicipes pollicipes]